MRSKGNLWAILLAAGDGTRVRPYTRDADGECVPKQYYAFDGRQSMLRWTVKRAAMLVPTQRIVAVVARQHRRWWQHELGDLAPENILAQPQNKGTAAGLLLPLLEILHRDPQATILVLPSDHYVADEACLSQVVNEAVQGALLNSFIIVTAGRTLLHLYDLTAPDLVGEFVSWQDRGSHDRSGLDALYPHLPNYDFSRQLLERSIGCLSVIRASPCGWSDLGTPSRVQQFRSSNGLEQIRATA